MSYYSSYGSYSGLTSSYSSYGSSLSHRSGRSGLSTYSSSNYEPYSWRNTSSYTPRTYDFGSSSFLSNSSSEHYSARYDEYSWKAKDLLTDNPDSKEVDVQLKESTREKLELTSVADSKDKEELVNIEDKENDDESNKESTKDYSRESDSLFSKDETTRYDSSYLHKENYSKDYSRDIHPKEDNSRDESSDVFKGYHTKDYSRDNEKSTRKDSSELQGPYNKEYYTKYHGSKRPKEDDKDSKTHDVQTENDEKESKVDSNVLAFNMNFLNEETKTSVPEKKVFDFEDNDVFIKPKNESSLKSGRGDILSNERKPLTTKASDNSSQLVITHKDRYSSIKEKPDNSYQRVQEPKSNNDDIDSRPLRTHRQEVAKFISAIPDQQRYVSSVNFLPDRIELRFIGVPHKHKKMRRCRSITELYEITVEPEQGEKQKKRIHPWEETIQCRKQDMSYSYDSENEILYYSKPRHEHTKEMYITQYTHHFDPDEPRRHIAAWKCDVEPNGIPHQKSRMCVLRSPIVSDSRRRLPRPKSAPPQLSARAVSPEEPIRSQKVEVVEREYRTLPRREARQEDFFFQNNDDESPTEDVSSVGYAPSDDTSDSSAFFFNDPRFHSQYQQENQPKDPDFGFNKPRLIRLSAEFPGVRNLEKMRRKRQSMGSYSSGGSRSSVGQSPSPRNGEYGFFVALTSDPRNPQPKRQHRHSHYY